MWAVFLITAPISFVLYWTVPDCKLDAQAHRYVSGFLLSMAWLSVAAWVVCEAALEVQDIWGIPASFTGLTVVYGPSTGRVIIAQIGSKNKQKVNNEKKCKN